MEYSEEELYNALWLGEIDAFTYDECIKEIRQKQFSKYKKYFYVLIVIGLIYIFFCNWYIL